MSDEKQATPGQAFRDTLRERWIARGRCVDMRDYDALPQEDRDDLEAAAWAAIQRRIDELDAQADPVRYALVEQMGFRRTYGTVREIEFIGKPMAEVTPLDGSGVRLVAPESLYQVTWLTREQAEHATRTGAHSVAATDAPRALSHVNLSGADPFGAWADDDDTDPNEGKDDGMSTAEREEYDRDAEFRLDAAQEARDLEREAEADE